MSRLRSADHFGSPWQPGGAQKERKVSDEGRKEKQRRVGDAEKTSEKEASNRVGRNDRLGYGWKEVEAREWGGGQKGRK